MAWRFRERQYRASLHGLVCLVPDETDALDMLGFDDSEHLVDSAIAGVRPRTEVKLGNGPPLLRQRQLLPELLRRDRSPVPQERSGLGDHQLVLERIWRRYAERRRRRQVELHDMGLRRDGDDQHDEEHKQNIDQRRGVHAGDRISVIGHKSLPHRYTPRWSTSISQVPNCGKERQRTKKGGSGGAALELGAVTKL